jgi:translation initiation factor 2-alpha kinase 4
VIARHSPTLRQKGDNLCAIGIQIALEKILAQLALFQSNYVKNLIKEERSFGYWSPRRCDVYVVSYHTGYLQDRLEVVSYLWQHNISADIMYESAISDIEHERLESVCEREGILYVVFSEMGCRNGAYIVSTGSQYVQGLARLSKLSRPSRLRAS